ncbi:MAG: DUF1992 domain-containing protein [Desulfobacteraceae bacterium]|nr:MAG: DUF1992 domain-containing protein [Desulfobacteraceae bacterium]
MLSGFEKIVEERIQKAQKDGVFENLPGSGKPLKFEDVNVPEDLRIAYKILKNANFLPPEIELRKQIQKTEDLLAGMKDTAERYKTIKKLNYLIFKLNSTRNTSAERDMPQYYLEKVCDALKSGD